MAFYWPSPPTNATRIWGINDFSISTAQSIIHHNPPIHSSPISIPNSQHANLSFNHVPHVILLTRNNNNNNNNNNTNTMVKFYELNYTYDYSFPAVTLAYFLRYPNPYSTHVLSTDVISRSLDPATGRLSTTRIHIKRSRLPSGVLKLLPSSVLGNVSRAGNSSSYVLERSTIDMREGWMETESRNLDWTGILSVVERQSYRRDLGTAGAGGDTEGSGAAAAAAAIEDAAVIDDVKAGTTDVTTSIKFRSRLGERLRARARRADGEVEKGAGRDVGMVVVEEEQPKKGFLANWSTAGIQRSIEAIASRRTLVSQGKSKEGMNVVLERLRSGGLWGALEGMRRDREAIFGHDGSSNPSDEGNQPRIDE